MSENSANLPEPTTKKTAAKPVLVSADTVPMAPIVPDKENDGDRDEEDSETTKEALRIKALREEQAKNWPW